MKVGHRVRFLQEKLREVRLAIVEILSIYTALVLSRHRLLMAHLKSGPGLSLSDLR